MSSLYISPTGAGRKDGSSPENAGTLANLNYFIDRAGPGGEVLLIADQGAYQRGTQLSITHGGAEGAPVTIRGIDSAGNPMDADIVGSRATDWEPGRSTGNELFRLLDGADNLVFQDLDIAHVGNGAFRVGADIENLVIRGVDATNVDRFIENYKSGTATSATIDGLTVQDCNIEGYASGAIRLQYDTHDVLIENVVGDSQGQNGGLYISGIALDGTAHNITIRQVEMKNSFGSGTTGEYWNGDGFTTERGNYNIVFEDTLASGNTDGGYDLKSSDTQLIRAVAEGNNKNFRLWSDSVTLVDCVSLDPKHYGGTGKTSHVWLAEGSHAVIQNLDFSDPAAAQLLLDLTRKNVELTLIDTDIPPAYAALLKPMGDTVIHTYHTPKDLALSGGDVTENAAGGTLVGTLSAIDPDSNAIISFAITGGADDLFEIVGNEIRVKAGARLDYEQATMHVVTVTATDDTGLSQSQDITIAVGDLADTATSGADLLVGWGAPIAGGAGNDTYVVTHATDTVIELENEGTDTVKTAFGSYTLGANIENLTYIGSGDFTGTGNSLKNTISGGDGSDFLRGGSGNDTLHGGAGDDTLYGDGNRDQIHGGGGNDLVRGGAFDDRIWGDDGDDELHGDDGADYIHGGNGNDFIDGGTSSDQMIGAAGDDTYLVDHAGDTVTEQVGQGHDTILASIGYTLVANVEDLVLSGTAAISGTGNGGPNHIIGNAAANQLAGGAGDDTLDGCAGNDRMVGGDGADTYILGAGQDVIVADAQDTLAMGSVRVDQVWLAREGEDLLLEILGSEDQVRFEGWFGASQNEIGQIAFADGAHVALGDLLGELSGISLTNLLDQADIEA